MLSYRKEIEDLRKEINRLNEEIIDKLVQRVEIAVEIGKIKRRNGQPIVDEEREKKVFDQVKELSATKKLGTEGVERVFREIIRLCTEAELED